MLKEAEAFSNYLSLSPQQIVGIMQGLTEEKIKLSQEKSLLDMFHMAATRVPAYRDFLKKNKINVEKISTLEDFKRYIPLTDKKNYLDNYDLEKLVIDGDLGKMTGISSSSGSSGNPYYWPRSLQQDLGNMLPIEASFIENFFIDKRKTLHITTLGMGVWTAGDLMSMSTRLISQKGYNFLSINPGLDLENIIIVIKSLGKFFEQIIITGYPSFMQDILDEGTKKGIDWKKIKVKFFFGGEPFAEEWRIDMLKKIKCENIYKDIFSTFGSSEGGIAGIETPLCLYTRKMMSEHLEMNEKIFKDSRTPSIVQFNPLTKYFEKINNELILTSSNAMPLIRYNTRDDGGVMYKSEFIKIMQNNGLDPISTLKESSIGNFWDLPILYLFGRSDTTATIYGLNIYPENIISALYGSSMKEVLSGKFYLKNEYKNKNNILLTVFELKRGKFISDQLVNKITNELVEHLKKVNSEYRKLNNSLGKKSIPKVILKEFGNEEFISKNKNKYVR